MAKTHFTLCAVAALTGSLCLGQESRGSILGRVSDSSGAVAGGAKISAVNTATNAGASSVSNQEGNFEIPYLLPGVYRVTAELAGFKKSVREGIELRVNDRLTLNFTLDVGNVTESVVVTGETPLLQAAEASMGVMLDETRGRDVPVIGGNVLHLAYLTPGGAVAGAGGGRNSGFPSDWNAATGLTINGARSNSSEVTLDGAPNMFETSSPYAPPRDLVQELKIQTAAYDASVGHAAGAVFNVSTKSGTNTLHGTANYDDARIHAYTWFANKFIYDPQTGPITQAKKDRLKPGYLSQRSSGTLRGPLVLPGLYNGRNRTFWSGGINWFHELWENATTATVPMPDQARGDFSKLLRLGPQYQIYDPLTTVPAAGGRFSRQPLAGNVVPASRIDPIAGRILNYWPAPNQPGTADDRQNFFWNLKKNMRYWGAMARVDHNFSDKHRLFVRYNWLTNPIRQQNLPTLAIGDVTTTDSRGGVIDDVYVFNPQLLLNLRYGITLTNPRVSRYSQGFDLLSLGLPRSLMDEIRAKNDPAGMAFPQVDVDGLTTIGAGGGNGRTMYYQTFAGTLTKITGNHSVRMGGEFRLLRENGYVFGSVSPNLVFSSTYAKGPLDNATAAPIGQGLASMLLGIPTGGGVNINASRAEQSTFSALYVQDDWKLTPRLTLNVGLRYEYEGPTTERFNRSLLDFDFQTASPIEAQARANYAKAPIPELPVERFRTVGGLTFAGVDGRPRSLWRSDRNNFAPRAGLAYQLRKKTVARAGYGIFYDLLGIDKQDVNQGGFNETTSLIPSLDNGQTFAATLANPFPTGFKLPLGAAGGLRTFLGRGATYFYQRPLNAYMQRWSFSLQQELPSRILLEAAYVGNRGNKLSADRQQNPVPRQYLSSSPVRDQPVIDLLSAQVRSPFAGIPEFSGTSLYNVNVNRAQLLRPYPHLTSLSSGGPIGFSYYHSLQVQAEKRLSRGLTFQASWTWSKFMEATGFLNETDARPEKVISDQDFPHRFTFSAVGELPFGKGKPLLGRARGILNAVIGGWQVQGTYQGQSGVALGFGNSIFNGRLDDITLPVSQRRVERWFNVDAGFERDSRKQLANNIRTLSMRFNNVRGDGLNNLDMSMFKNFRLTERLSAQFRVESYNALNHAQFTAPNTNPASTAFGTVTGERGQNQRQFSFGCKVMF